LRLGAAVPPSSNGSAVACQGSRCQDQQRRSVSWWRQRPQGRQQRSEFPGSPCGGHVQREGKSGRRRESNSRKTRTRVCVGSPPCATQAATSRWLPGPAAARGPRPGERGRNGRRANHRGPVPSPTTPRVAGGPHTRAPVRRGPRTRQVPVALSSLRARHRPRTTGAGQWAAASGLPRWRGRSAGAPRGWCVVRTRADPRGRQAAAGRGRGASAGVAGSAAHTWPWGPSPTRSRYSRDHERKGQTASPAAHAQAARRAGRTIAPYAHTDATRGWRERSTRPTVGEVGLRKRRPRPPTLKTFGVHTVSVSREDPSLQEH
jgi:hypothetical protein